MSPRRILAKLAVILPILSGTGAAIPAPALAQGYCADGDTSEDCIDPKITHNLTAGSYLTGNLNVEIYWCSVHSLDPFSSATVVLFNDSDVTSQFSFQYGAPRPPECADYGKSTGTVSVREGDNDLLFGMQSYDNFGTYYHEDWKGFTGISRFVNNTSATNNDNQNAKLCGMSCFAATYSQSTVPYISLDAPRQVTLAYHGDRSSLRPFVHVDVNPTPGQAAAQEYQLQAKVNSALVTFLNGDQTLRFSGSSSQVRLGGQFDAGSYGTGVHPFQIIATALYSGGGSEQKITDAKLLVLNDRSSHIARGWAIAGLQRVHPVTGGVVVTDGNGSAAHFTNDCGTGCYTSPAGDFSRVTSSGAGYVRAYPDSTKATFNTAGQLTKVADRFGNSTDFEYDGSGRLTRIYDPFRTYNGGANRSYIALSYGAYGLSQIQEPGPDGSPTGGRITYITVHSDSTLRVFKDPDGDSTRFGYDGSRRLSTITDRRGGVTTYNYDANSGKLASVDLPTVTLWDNSSIRPRTSYSPWQSMSVPTGSTASVPFTPVPTANINGGATDALGRQTSMTTDHWGQALSITDPIGRTTIINRTGVHPTSVQHPTGAIDYATFSGALLTSATPAGATQQNIRYGAWAQPDSVWGTGRVPMRAILGPNGRVDSVRIGGADSLKIKYFYDSRGRVDSIIDPGGHVTKYQYDAVFGNLDSTLAPGNRFTKLAFDGYGRVQTQRANDEPQRQVVYDAINRVREVHDGVNPLPTLYKYDQLYLQRVQDPKEQVFRFDNNALGWVTREYDPADTLSRYDTFGYDSAGNVRTWTNRRGQQISYTYDSLNRPRSKSGTNTTTDSVAYSADGLKMVSWNSVSRDSVFLRSTGWVDSVVTRIAGRRFRRLYLPTDIQRLAAVEFDNDASITFANRRFTWNGQTGALDTAIVNGQATRFARNREMLPIQTTWPSLYRNHQWTAIHRPGEQSFSDATVNTALFRRYGYDSRSNLRDRIRWDGSNLRTQQAGYDGLRRLGNQGDNLFATSQCTWDASSGYLCPLSFQHQVTFDAAGNRTDAANAAYATGNRIESFGNYTFTHDLDGNIAEKYNTVTAETKQFEWSAEGRLTRVLVNSTERVRYDYNAGGQLVRRWTNGSVDRHFLWDQGHLLAELDANATQRIGEYAYLPGADQPLALITGAQSIGTIRYLVQDETGNIVATLNGTTIDQHASYDDWGVATVSGHGENRLLFKGLLWEGSYTGMYYMRARWYDPELGRFISEDPCGLADGPNLYTFAGNDAINGHDPSGCLSLKGIVKSVIRWAPVAAFAIISHGAGLGAAVKAMGATALGSATAAGIEHGATGTPFWRAFQRNFGISSANLAFSVVIGGGIANTPWSPGAGANGAFQGYVETNGKMGGFTLGSAASFNGIKRMEPVVRGLATTWGQHELGHTIQFVMMSRFRGAHGLGPWLPYAGLGLLGIAGGYDGWTTPTGILGCIWEGMATALGRGVQVPCAVP